MHDQADAYLKRGVSASKDEVKLAIKQQSKGLFAEAFCKIVPDIAGDPDYVSVLHADGAGTKATIAYMSSKITGETKWYRNVAQDALVMNTDDMLCVGVLDQIFISNTIGRNAHRIDGTAIAEIINGYDDCIEMFHNQGVTVTMTGGETADVGDLVRTLICDATAMARLPRSEVIDLGNLRPGLAIVGLASYGQSTYELTENSGIGSNGLTAARHLLLSSRYRTQFPETYAETMAQDVAYVGKYLLDDILPNSKMSVGEALSSPTRTYLPVIKVLKTHLNQQIIGLVHCTGGGQVKCASFGTGIRFVKNNLLMPPPIFAAISASGEIRDKERFRIFNMGHRLELYVEPSFVADVIAVAAQFGIVAQQVGFTEIAAKPNINEVIVVAPDTQKTHHWIIEK